MNRKLHHTVMALTATASVFTVLLLAASPVGPATRSVLAPAPLPTLVTDASAIATGAADSIQDSANQRRHLRHSRALLALPYFSFAQGLRRNRS